MNHGKYDLKVLQFMMRHKSETTTQRYLKIEIEARRTFNRLYVPDVRKSAIG